MLKMRKPGEVPKASASDDELRSVTLKLPSECKDYPEPARGDFELKPPTVAEVEFLAGMNEDNYDDLVTKMLSRLILKPSIVDSADLTVGDRQYLHLWTRAQIDPVYQFDAICPNPKCKEKVNKNYRLNISDIPLVPTPSEYKASMKLTFPKSKKKVQVRLETGRDRMNCTSLVAAGHAKWSARRSQIILSIDGRPLASPEEKLTALRSLPAGDDMFMGEYLAWQKHGPNFGDCPFKCNHCGKEARIKMPFRLEFYLPTLHAAAALRAAVGGGVDGEDGGVSGAVSDQ